MSVKKDTTWQYIEDSFWMMILSKVIIQDLIPFKYFRSQSLNSQLLLIALNKNHFSGTYMKFKFSKKATKINKIFTVDLEFCSKRQINGEDFIDFCGLHIKHKL